MKKITVILVCSIICIGVLFHTGTGITKTSASNFEVR